MEMETIMVLHGKITQVHGIVIVVVSIQDGATPLHVTALAVRTVRRTVMRQTVTKFEKTMKEGGNLPRRCRGSRFWRGAVARRGVIPSTSQVARSVCSTQSLVVVTATFLILVFLANLTRG